MRISVLFRRLRAALSRSRMDAELQEEIAAHLDARRRALLAEGLSEDAARQQAQREFGNATAIVERARDARGLPRLESVLQDARFGARLLRQAPLFTLVAVLSIAFGLSGGLGIFTVANALILRPIVTDGADLYRVFTSSRDGSPFNSTSYADYRDFARARGFGGWCVMEHVRANLAVGTSAAARNGAVVTGGCFDVLRLRPFAGRLLTPSSTSEAVISYALWKRQFAGDPAAVGTSILLNGAPAIVVGIAPAGFSGTSLDESADFWVPIEHFGPALLPARALDERRNRIFVVYTRLRDGISRAQAEAELAGITRSLQAQDPAAWTDSRGGVRRVTVMKETEARFAGSPGALPALVFGVIAAIAAIVSIACVNIATMLLARGAARTRELTIRLAIGASRGRLLRQLATESLLIAILGTALALAGITTAIRMFAAWRPEGVPAVDLAIDWRVALFSAGVALLATLFFGLLPAAHVVRLAIAEGMKGRVGAVRSRWMRAGTREVLIVVQVTASVGLLLVSTLFARGFAAGAASSPGFTTDGIASIGVELGTTPNTEAPAIVRRIVEAVGRVPDVDRPAIAAIIPLTGTATGFLIGDSGSTHEVDGNIISPGYLSTVGMAVRRGRDFAETDTAGSPPVALVSEALARKLWGTTAVVGRTLTFGKGSIEVVGVVSDIRYRTVTGPPAPLLYLPVAQSRSSRFVIHARVRGGGETLAAMERAARSVDPRVIIDNARPLSERLEDVRAPERLSSWIAAGAGVVQFALVLMALWALVAYAVERRTREIGIRVALGATSGGVVRMLLRPALILIALGAVLGSAAGFTAAAIFQSEFIALGALDPLAGAPAILVMAIVAAVAAFVPARRATRVDPIVALRAE